MTLAQSMRAAVRSGRRTASAERLRPLARVLAIYALARAVTTGFLLCLDLGGRTTVGVRPGLLRLSSAWDGRWYRSIALHGYPAHPPVDAHGHLAQNAWAFLPVYPALTRLLTEATGLPWAAAAVGLSVVAGAGAAILLLLLLAPRIGAARAMFAVALFACSPVAFVLQTTYAESLMLCLVLGALLLIERRRYAALVPVLVVMAFTRPGVLAFALTLALHGVQRALAARGGEEPFPVRDRIRVGALVLLATAAGFAWPVVAGVVTGDPHTYFETEAAWRSLWLPRGGFPFFHPWVFVVQYLFGDGWGLVVLGGVLAACTVFALSAPVRRLGAVQRAWVVSYGLYLLAVFMPQSSLPRVLLPMAPLLGAAPGSRSRTGRIALLAASLGLQLLWLWCTYGPISAYWAVP